MFDPAIRLTARVPDAEPRFTYVFGRGGFGREMLWLLRHLHQPAEVAGIIDDAATDDEPTVNGAPVLSLRAAAVLHPGAAYLIAIGDGAVREEVAARCEAAGLIALPAAVHTSVELDPSVRVGAGSVLCAGTLLTVDIAVGRHVHVNLGCTIGHDTVLEDFVTLAPGVHVSGNCRLERGCYVGTGAVMRQGVTIGAGATLGMGAVLTKDLPPGEMWVGNPARPVRRAGH